MYKDLERKIIIRTKEFKGVIASKKQKLSFLSNIKSVSYEIVQKYNFNYSELLSDENNLIIELSDGYYSLIISCFYRNREFKTIIYRL